MHSEIEFINGKPFILVDGKAYAPLAYTTYFEERSRYEDFIAAGYRIFFILMPHYGFRSYYNTHFRLLPSAIEYIRSLFKRDVYRCDRLLQYPFSTS